MWKLIDAKILENLFFEKALFSRWDDTVMYIDLKDEILKLPQIDTEDLRKCFLKEVEEEIEKMIEEYENEQKRISKWSSLHYDLSMYIKTLQELLQKFKS